MIEITLPPMGEGIIEAEITRWMVREGMQVELDQSVVEVATDKVDS
jgi:pyruvate/2-oxoglutarate dehydrogenase complex dihydrolipoamide acyltransferase (E2) component